MLEIFLVLLPFCIVGTIFGFMYAERGLLTTSEGKAFLTAFLFSAMLTACEGDGIVSLRPLGEVILATFLGMFTTGVSFLVGGMIQVFVATSRRRRWLRRERARVAPLARE